MEEKKDGFNKMQTMKMAMMGAGIIIMFMIGLTVISQLNEVIQWIKILANNFK